MDCCWWVSASSSGVSAPSEDLEREVEQLRIENRMMWILKDENKALSARVQVGR